MAGLFAERLAQMRIEWSGNPRLRIGVGLVVVILVFYLLMVLADWRTALHAQYQQRTLQLYKVQALAGKDEWLLRAENARTLDKALRSEIPSAATIGLAQAEVQTWMRQIMQAFGPKMGSQPHAPDASGGRARPVAHPCHDPWPGFRAAVAGDPAPDRKRGSVDRDRQHDGQHGP